MFPIGDDNSAERTFPIVTYALIALNVLFFFVELSGGDQFVNQYAFVPSRFLANPSADFPTLFTSMFMHAGWVHLGGNMLYLWIFGDNVEDRFGHGRFLAFYLFCGAIAVFGQVAVHPASLVPMIGASGAIAGVMGAYFVLYPHSRVLTAVFIIFFIDLIEIPAVFFLGIWFLMQLFSGVGSIGASAAGGGVAFWAHVSGFVTGLTFGLFRRWRDAMRPGYW
jgi:membrane associated rhomboid family serine protease